MKIYGYTGAFLELGIFYVISKKIKNKNFMDMDSNISYYWLCFTILTGIWELFYILNYKKVINMSNNLLKYNKHVWFKKYKINMILPWKLSHIFYSEYGAYADREYMTNKEYWSRIIEGSHLTLCGYMSFFTLYYYYYKNYNNYYLYLGIAMGTQLMNSILYMSEYMIQTKTRNSINYNTKTFPVGRYLDKRPFMWINIFWTVMPAYILYIHIDKYNGIFYN